jgi:hypothetical protein
VILCAREGSSLWSSPVTGPIPNSPLDDHMQTNSAKPAPLSPTLDRQSLRPDCGNCFALCCTAFGFSRSADFALDKPAGAPCQNLAPDFSCTIHNSLRPRGFRGCTVFDCFGAGQKVSQGLFGGTSWREDPGTKEQMFAAFKAVRQLHEMLWHLAEARRRTFDPDVAHRAMELGATIGQAVDGGLQQLLALDVQDLHTQVRSTLMEVIAESGRPTLPRAVITWLPDWGPEPTSWASISGAAGCAGRTSEGLT